MDRFAGESVQSTVHVTLLRPAGPYRPVPQGIQLHLDADIGVKVIQLRLKLKLLLLPFFLFWLSENIVQNYYVPICYCEKGFRLVTGSIAHLYWNAYTLWQCEGFNSHANIRSRGRWGCCLRFILFTFPLLPLFLLGGKLKLWLLTQGKYNAIALCNVLNSPPCVVSSPHRWHVCLCPCQISSSSSSSSPCVVLGRGRTCRRSSWSHVLTRRVLSPRCRPLWGQASAVFREACPHSLRMKTVADKNTFIYNYNWISCIYIYIYICRFIHQDSSIRCEWMKARAGKCEWMKPIAGKCEWMKPIAGKCERINHRAHWHDEASALTLQWPHSNNATY